MNFFASTYCNACIFLTMHGSAVVDIHVVLKEKQIMNIVSTCIHFKRRSGPQYVRKNI